jgi:hypothetical protein
LAEAESTAENLLTALAGLNIKARKATERVSILIGQLKKVFLSLVIIRKEEAVMVLKIKYTIYRLMTPRTRDNTTQIMEITC